jgi:hypothetical protein
MCLTANRACRLASTAGGRVPPALPRRRMLINVLLLRIVQAYQGLDRLDHALGVADEVAVGVGGRQVPGEAVDEAREVQDLAVRAAHGAEAVAVGEEAGEAGIDGGLVGTLMDHDLACDKAVGFRDQRHRGGRFDIIERVGDFPEPIKGGVEVLMLLTQRRGSR